MAAVDDLLVQIDHTLNDTAISHDAMRWTPDAPAPVAVRLPRLAPPRINPEAIAALNRSFNTMAENMREAFAKLVKPIPADPRERALYLRQHRNTGPAGPRLDGRRTR